MRELNIEALIVNRDYTPYSRQVDAYEMNGKPLPEKHEAPLHLRMETMVGFKMVKWIKSIEFVEDYRKIGLGHGGYRKISKITTKALKFKLDCRCCLSEEKKDFDAVACLARCGTLLMNDDHFLAL